MNISDRIKARLTASGKPWLANDNIAGSIEDGEMEELLEEVTEKVSGLLSSLVIDVENDHNMRETARRVAKMYLREVFHGRYDEPPKATEFPNVKHLDEIYAVGPIQIRSACSHHLVPIIGRAWVGVFPSDKVIGLSKFSRILEWVFARPHIQEEAVIMAADHIENLIQPQGLALVLKAQHMCTSWRGVKESSMLMTNSIMRGKFREDSHAKQEFFRMIEGNGFSDPLV
jgi:GTP cyclohydrolase I